MSYITGQLNDTAETTRATVNETSQDSQDAANTTSDITQQTVNNTADNVQEFSEEVDPKKPFTIIDGKGRNIKFHSLPSILHIARSGKGPLGLRGVAKFCPISHKKYRYH